MASEVFKRYSQGGGGNSVADTLAAFRTRGAARRLTAQTVTPGDPDWADRFINDQSQTPSAYAEASLLEARGKAQRALTEYPDAYDANQREKLQQIANTGTVRKGNWFLNALNVLDNIGAETLRMGVADVTGVDTQFGKEITLTDYVDALFGREDLVRARLGTELAGDSQFLVPGSKIMEGWGVENKVARGAGGFLADVLLDPTSYVTFGLAGLGKKAAQEGAQSILATAAKRGLGGEIAEAALKPLERRIAQAAASVADEATELVTERLAQKVAKETGTEVDDLLRESVRGEARERVMTWERTSAELLANNPAAKIDKELAEIYAEAGIKTGTARVTDDVLSLITQKKFKSLKRDFGDFIDYDLTNDFLKGGVRIGLPVFRKSTKMLGSFGRTDISLRGMVDSVTSKIPGPAHEIVDTIVRRMAFESPEVALASRGLAWEATAARNATRAAQAMQKTGQDAVASVSVALERVLKAADATATDIEVANKALARMLGTPTQGGSLPVLPSLGKPVLDDALDTAYQAIRQTMTAMHHALKESGQDIGEIDGYFPMLASKQFSEIVSTLGNQGTKLSWEGITNPELRMGYQLLSEFVGATSAAKRSALANPGQPRNALERTSTKGIWSQHGSDFSMAEIDGEVWQEFLAMTGTGYISHNKVNEVIGLALRDLKEKGTLARKLPDDIAPFSENVAEVLDNYVASMSKAINFRTYINNARALGLIDEAPKRVYTLRTLAEAHANIGPDLLRRVEQFIIAAESGAASKIDEAAALVEVKVAKNWTINVPAVLVDQPEFQRLIERLGKRLGLAEQFRNATINEQKLRAKEWIRQGVPEDLADRLAAAKADTEIAAVHAEMDILAQQQAAALISATQEVVLNSPELSVKAQRAAVNQSIREADKLMKETRAAITSMHDQWRRRFSWREVKRTEHYNFDLLGFAPDGRQWLAHMADDVSLVMGKELRERTERVLAEKGAHVRGDMVARFTTQNVRFKDLRRQMPKEVHDELAEMFGIKSRSERFVHHLMNKLPTKSFDDLNSRPLAYLWQASYGPTKANILEAADGMDRMNKVVNNLLRVSKDTEKMGEMMVHIRSMDLPMIIEPANRRALYGVLTRAGFERKFLEITENSIRYRPVDREVFRRRLLFKDVVADMRTLVGDVPADRLPAKITRADGSVAPASTSWTIGGRRIWVDEVETYGINRATRSGSVTLKDGTVIKISADNMEDWGTLSSLQRDMRDIGNELADQQMSLDDWVEANLRGADAAPDMTRAELVEAVKQADMTLAPENVQIFMRQLGPDGDLPFEMRELDAMEDLIVSLKKQKAGLRRSNRVNDKMLRNYNEVETALNKITTQMERVVRGDPTPKLRRTWELTRSSLRGNLPIQEYNRIANGIEYLLSNAHLKGPGAQMIERNQRLFGPAMWTSLDEGMQQLETYIDETAQALIDEGGEDLTWAAEALRHFRYAYQQTVTQHSPGSLDETVDLFSEAAEAAFRGVKNPATGKREGGVIQYAKEAARGLDTVAGVLPGEANQEVRRAAEKMAGTLHDIEVVKTRTAERGGFVSPSVANIAGDALKGVDLDRDVALMLENMATHIKSVGTPLGLRLLSEDASAFLRWWRAAATVGRPSFVPRNFIGGIFNNRIIGVRARDYMDVGLHMVEFRRLVEQKGLLPTQALAEMPERLRGKMEGLLRSELLLSAYSTDLARVTGGPDKIMQLATMNPLDAKHFAIFRMGGKAMQSSEDFLRAAAFFRHYDPLRPETMDFAKEMALAVHFDYAHLTPLEQVFKRWVPFFVWTRRNIPLQIRVAVENPGLITKYQHLVTEADDYFDQESIADTFPGSSYESGLSVQTDATLNEDTPFWARIVIDPDLPIKDLESLARAFGDGEQMQFFLRMLHPGISAPAGVMATKDYPTVNAPSGLRELITGWQDIWGEPKTDEFGNAYADVSYGTRTIANTAVPFLQEWLSMLGIQPSDPRQSARLGYNNEDGVDWGERFRAIGLTAGRAAGVGVQTPADALGPASMSKDFIDALLRDLEMQGKIDKDR